MRAPSSARRTSARSTSGPFCPRPRSRPSPARCSRRLLARRFHHPARGTGRHLHVLADGEADVRVPTAGGARSAVNTMTAGACFGEMSLLSGDVTSADVVATTTCATLTLDRPDVRRARRRPPAAAAGIRPDGVAAAARLQRGDGCGAAEGEESHPVSPGRTRGPVAASWWARRRRCAGCSGRWRPSRQATTRC